MDSGILNKAPLPWASTHSAVDKTVHPVPMVTLGASMQNVNSSSSLAYVHMVHPWGSTHGHHLTATLAGCVESRCMPLCVVLTPSASA